MQELPQSWAPVTAACSSPPPADRSPPRCGHSGSPQSHPTSYPPPGNLDPWTNTAPSVSEKLHEPRCFFPLSYLINDIFKNVSVIDI